MHELTSFVGRRHELDEVKRLLSAARLVTLTGTGGVGKTRLAVRAADGLRRAFPDGAWLAELADLDDDALLTPAVAAALDLRDATSRWPVATLIDHLAGKRLLLVLDNCEHLLDACAVLADALLRGCPGLRVLATSRQPLGIAGETTLAVGPLSLPGDDDGPEALGRSDAVRLFADRAAAVRPGFTIDEANAAAVAALCRRLEGIPLAIELAAGRLRALTVEQVAERLDDRLRLLTGGSRTALPRHQTLRATVDWSYDLLTEPERALWRRLSVFAGGFDLPAAEAVGAGGDLPEADVLDLLAGLVDKSIVLMEPHGAAARYRLLEAVREHGRERLTASGEAAAVRRRHRDLYAGLAALDRGLSHDQVAWLERLHTEEGNLRVALESSLADGEPEAGLKIASDLWLFWETHGHLGEGRRWLRVLLDACQAATRTTARGLWVAGYLALVQGDPDGAEALLRESLDLGQRLGDEATVAFAHQFLGRWAMFAGDLDTAAGHTGRAVALHRGRGGAAHVSLALVQLGLIESFRGDHERALASYEEADAICAALGERWNRSYVLWGLGITVLRQGDPGRAGTLEREALRLKRDLDDRVGIPGCVEALAWVAGTGGDHERAARLLGAARVLRAGVQTALPGPFAADRARCEAAARAHLGDDGFARALAAGARLDPAGAVAAALGEEPAAATPSASAPSTLTPRETEVAELVAEGLSDREIADHLVIARRTAETHVQHILRKLGARSRAQVAAWVAGRR